MAPSTNTLEFKVKSAVRFASRAFTLIELLVVIAIIAILAATILTIKSADTIDGTLRSYIA